MSNQYVPPGINPARVIFLLSLIVSFFWITSRAFNISHYKIAGALFEILWLPMVMMLFVLPVLSVIYWSQKKFSGNSLYPWSLLMIAASIIMMLLRR
jgi:hypothetical protein